MNTELQEMNEQWVELLNEDPWLHVAYDVMLLMIK